MDAMCATTGDYDGNGYLDLYVTNSPNAPEGTNNVLLRNNGDGTFTEMAQELGVDVGVTGWGSHFLDLDNDGDLDLFVCNADSEVGNSVFENDGDGSFHEILARKG